MALINFLQMIGLSTKEIIFLFSLGPIWIFVELFKIKHGRFLKYTQQDNTIIKDRRTNEEYIESKNGTITKL